jgi:hypothetical protein
MKRRCGLTEPVITTAWLTPAAAPCARPGGAAAHSAASAMALHRFSIVVS